MRNAILLAAAFGLTVPAIPALAQRQLTVEHADLDLDTKQGQKTLDRRIRAAAERICDANQVVTGSRLMSREAKRCIAEVTATARKSVASQLGYKKLGG